MGCDTRANLIGFVSESEIASFLAKNFRCRASYLNVESRAYCKKSEVSEIKVDYDNDEHWVTISGPIVLEFLGNQHGFQNGETRSLFYISNNVNFYENLDYYEELGLGEMVRSRTTHISARTETGNIALVRAVVEEFGGWFTENDCGEEYVRVYGRREAVNCPTKDRRVDIVTNVKTITGDCNSPITRICAIRTNVENGILSDVFDKSAAECGGAHALLTEFCQWVSKMQNEITSIEDIHIWNSGSLYADIVLRRACETLGIEYPIVHSNSRDVHTLFDIVVTKKGYASEEAYIAEMEKNIDGEVLDNESDYAYKLAKILYKTYSLALGRK